MTYQQVLRAARHRFNGYCEAQGLLKDFMERPHDMDQAEADKLLRVLLVEEGWEHTIATQAYLAAKEAMR